jgi:hypothetical protein
MPVNTHSTKAPAAPRKNAKANHSSFDEETALQSILKGGFLQWLRLPTLIEEAFRQDSRQRASNLLHQSIYGLVALYLMVVVPIFLMSGDNTMPAWIAFGMLPIGAALGGMWVTTRLPAMAVYVESTLSISLFVCLLGTVYCSMLLQGKYFGQMAAYETIYILIVAFSILQLPARFALSSALCAFVLALFIALVLGSRPYWLDVMLYFGIPLMICTVNGYILELSARRNFVQNLLLNKESQRLALLHEAAEHETLKQQQHADFLALISGNLSLEELFSRGLRFLIERTNAQIGVAYHLGTDQRLYRISSWAGDATTLEGKKEISMTETLMGPALKTGAVMRLSDIPAGYLPIRLGMGTLPAVSVMVVPIRQNDEALAVIELGRITPFSDEDCRTAEATRLHFAYAIIAANARNMLQNSVPTPT